MCETRDQEHANELERVLRETYTKVNFGKITDHINEAGFHGDMDSH